jgi:GNAT superfamily N-acetyltransferase
MALHDYPYELEGRVTLPNRQQLRIRPLRPGEEAAVRDLDAHLSVGTRYRRFFSPLPALPDSILRLLASVDYRQRLALVAELEAADRREVVALGSFGAIDARTVEVALLVSDDWQHLGVGTVLAGRLLEAAEDRGFTRFVAQMLCDNAVIRQIVRRLGQVVSTRAGQGVCEVTFVRRDSRAA